MRATAVILFCGKEWDTSVHRLRSLLSSRANLLQSSSPSRWVYDVRQCEQKDVGKRLLEWDVDVAVPLMCRMQDAWIAEAASKGRLRLIQQWGVGLEGVNVDSATQAGVLVSHTPNDKADNSALARAQSLSTAEMAIYLLLGILRRARDMDSVVKNIANNVIGNGMGWGAPRGQCLSDAAIFLIGFGSINKHLAQCLRGFGCSKIYATRSRPVESWPDQERLMVDHPFAMENLVERINSIPAHTTVALSLALPLNSTSLHLLNEANFFSRLKRPIYLVNVGRGNLIERTSLEHALKRELVLGFGADVWWQEPPVLDPLLQNLKDLNVLVTPHVGGTTEQGAARMDKIVADSIFDFFESEGKTIPRHCVNASKVGKFVAPFGASRRGFCSSTNTKGFHMIKPPLMTRRADGRSSIQTVIEELGKIETVSSSQIDTNAYALTQHGKDESLHDSAPPEAVFYPKSTSEVAAAARICSKHHVPIIPFGVGTSLEGGVGALNGGLCIDLGRHMTQIIDVRVDDMDVRVEAGVTRKQLEKYLAQSGLYFPVDPGADATLGGMCSTRASGTTAIKYGTMKNLVMGLTVVTVDGEILKTGGRARKSSAGYDLTSLFCGAEGTLGIITEVQLRLFGRPSYISCATCAFPDLHSAVETVVRSLQVGVPFARAELLDSVTMRAVAQYNHEEHNKQTVFKPTIFLEFHGISKQAVQEQAEIVREIAEELGGSAFERTEEPEKWAKLWHARHTAYYAAKNLRGPNTQGWPTDVCVPISELASLIEETAKDAVKENLVAPIFGHIGDGNFHVILLYNPDIDGEKEMNSLLRVNSNLIGRALQVGGTCTGEHGVGFGKMGWMIQEHGKEGIKVMRQIKRALDPQNLMNPGKVVPFDEDFGQTH